MRIVVEVGIPWLHRFVWRVGIIVRRLAFAGPCLAAIIGKRTLSLKVIVLYLGLLDWDSA